MISCLIVDDEPLARNLLEQYVKKIPFLHLIQTCPDPLVALEVLRENTVDLLFLDIQMPEITGISLLKIMQKKPLVVLTTAYSEYALEGYELDVADYLLKPITFERFLKTIDKISQRITPTLPTAEIISDKTAIEKPYLENTQPFMFVKDGTKLVKVRLSDILYIEGLKDYVSIYTTQQKIVTLQRLKTLETSLPADDFIRIHHSYIVALSAIEVIHKDKVQIGKVFLPVSDTYRKAFKTFIDSKGQ
jgi:two-component system, LytTR family, response regulator